MSTELDAWLAEHLFGYQEVHQEVAWTGGLGSPRKPKSEWPWYRAGDCYETSTQRRKVGLESFSTTGDGMLLVMEAMRERGFDTVTMYAGNGVQHGAMFFRIGARPYAPREALLNLNREPLVSEAGNMPLPLAVAKAAKLALEVIDAALVWKMNKAISTIQAFDRACDALVKEREHRHRFAQDLTAAFIAMVTATIAVLGSHCTSEVVLALFRRQRRND